MEQADARDVLRQIIVTYGRDVATDSRRLESLLRDLCGGNKREITLLISAARENVPGELTATSAATLPRDLLLSRLRARLEENLSITSQAAQWAVESWALALDQIQASSLTTQHLTSDRAASDRGGAAGQSPILDRPAPPGSGPATPVTPNSPPVTPAQPGFVQASQPGYAPAPETPLVTPSQPGFAPANSPGYTPPGPPNYSPPNQPGFAPANQQSSYNPYNSMGMVAPQSKATMALILGIVGILACWACGLGLLASIPAWVFGSGELKAIIEGRLPASNKSQAQVGMILGIIGVVLAIAAGIAEIIIGSHDKSS